MFTKREEIMRNVSFALSMMLVLCGCSDDSREEASARLSTAAKALTGEIRANDKVPRIVKEQQRKEHKRQDTEWTPENQALHPIEYCQAQLERLSEYSTQLDVQAHKYAVAKNQVLRGISDAEAQLAGIARFLEEAKRAYKAADASNKWPVMIGGFALSKEKAQEKIVAAAERRPMLQATIARNKNMLAALEKKIVKVSDEQKNIVKIKERIQITLNDLNLKKVVDGDNGITDALNTINDSLGALKTDYDDPSVDDLLVPDKASAIKVSFDAIMAE